MKTKTHIGLFFIGIIFFIILISSLASATAKLIISENHTKKIAEIIENDLLRLKTAYAFAQRNKQSVWAKGDIAFYELLLRGLKKEKAHELGDAIFLYNKALKVTRYEMSTYEALFPLGRSHLINRNCSKAESLLTAFIKEANMELTKAQVWSLTEEGEKTLRQRIEDAVWLI
jgi:hypothetical protein